MHSQIIVEVFPSSRYCLPEHTLRNSGFNRFTAALLKGRLKFCFLHNAFYEIQRRRIPTFSDHTRLHGQVHGTCVSRVTCAVGHEFPDLAERHFVHTSGQGHEFFLPQLLPCNEARDRVVVVAIYYST